MTYFAGLDVSLEETAICVVDETGRIVKETRAASDPEALADALRHAAAPLARIGLEACSLTAWLLVVLMIQTFARAGAAQGGKCLNRTTSNLLNLVELLNLTFEREPGRKRDSNVKFAPLATY